MMALTTFTDRFAGETFPMLPPPEMRGIDQLALVLAMSVSPHPILTLCVVLIALAPLGVWMLHRRLIRPSLALS